MMGETLPRPDSPPINIPAIQIQLLDWLGFAVLQTLVNDRSDFAIGLVGYSSLLRAELALFRSKLALLLAQLALLCAEFALLVADLSLQIPEPALQITKAALQIAQFFLGDVLAHFGLKLGHRVGQFRHLLAHVRRGNTGLFLLTAQRLLLLAQFFLLAAELFLLLAQLLHRLVHGLDLRDGGLVVYEIFLAITHEPEEVAVGELARLIDIARVNVAIELHVLTVVTTDDGIGVAIVRVVIAVSVARVPGFIFLRKGVETDNPRPNANYRRDRNARTDGTNCANRTDRDYGSYGSNRPYRTDRADRTHQTNCCRHDRAVSENFSVRRIALGSLRCNRLWI